MKTINKKVILELYMDVWYCYEDSAKKCGIAYAIFTTDTQIEAENLCREFKYEVTQVIDMSYLDEDGNEITSHF